MHDTARIHANLNLGGLSPFVASVAVIRAAGDTNNYVLIRATDTEMVGQAESASAVRRMYKYELIEPALDCKVANINVAELPKTTSVRLRDKNSRHNSGWPARSRRAPHRR